MSSFEVGKVYYTSSYGRPDSMYRIVKKNEDTERITIQEVTPEGKPCGKKIVRRYYLSAVSFSVPGLIERITIRQPSITPIGVCLGGVYLSSN